MNVDKVKYFLLIECLILYNLCLGSGQTKGFCPLLDVFIPSIYWIFRVTHNSNRWRIINQMFAKSLPLDARVKNMARWRFFA